MLQVTFPIGAVLPPAEPLPPVDGSVDAAGLEAPPVEAAVVTVALMPPVLLLTVPELNAVLPPVVFWPPVALAIVLYPPVVVVIRALEPPLPG